LFFYGANNGSREIQTYQLIMPTEKANLLGIWANILKIQFNQHISTMFFY